MAIPGYSTTKRLVRQELLPSALSNSAKNSGGLRKRGYVKKSEFQWPLISVITVVYNGVSSLEPAILSVLNQAYDNIEYIVIDGGSADGTLDLIRNHENHIDFWVSEPDGGVYEAMNKGVGLATGDWIYFLGADDILVNNLHHMVPLFTKKNAVYYGDTYWRKRNTIESGELDSYAISKKNICHQAIFYPRLVFEHYRFDLNYRVLADYALNLQCWADPKFKFVYLPFLVALFKDGGMSSQLEDPAFEADKPALCKKLRLDPPFRFYFREHILKKKETSPAMHLKRQKYLLSRNHLRFASRTADPKERKRFLTLAVLLHFPWLKKRSIQRQLISLYFGPDALAVLMEIKKRGPEAYKFLSRFFSDPFFGNFKKHTRTYFFHARSFFLHFFISSRVENCSTKISILITTYPNKERDRIPALRNLLTKSLPRQTYKNYEAIVYSDGAYSKAQELISSLKDERVKYYETPQMLGKWGHPQTREGIRIATGDFFVRMNDDNRPYPRFLETLCGGFENGVGIVYARVHFKGQARKDHSLSLKTSFLLPQDLQGALKVDNIDCMNYMVRMDLAKRYASFWCDEFAADWFFIEKLVNEKIKAKFVDQIIGEKR